jgi:UDP-N-acetyl-D-galactosamine dehydrogenase
VEEAQHEYNITPIHKLAQNHYDGIIVAVAHQQFKAMGADYIKSLGRNECVLYDLKSMFKPGEATLRL